MDPLPAPLLNALKFEKSNWAQGSVLEHPSYRCPQEAANLPPGSLIKLEKNVDTTSYLIPSATAMSRILYQSETLKGHLVPVSAFVLWPYSPRSQPDGYSVVAWAHGTSGADANTAPSNNKTLWQHFLAPYQLALQGYVVVATDYAGLGVEKTASGEHITHEYLSPPSQANDVVYSVKAAQEAFPELSKQFVVLGHSQGGGAAWAVAQKAASSPIPSLLGIIAISPYTDFLNEHGRYRPLMPTAMCRGMASAMPDFNPKDILTVKGEACVDIMFGLGAGLASAMALFTGVDPLKSSWELNAHILEFSRLTANGGKAIQGPLLVIHGQADAMNTLPTVEKAVTKTIERFPDSQLEFVTLPGVTHAPALPASQRLWMDWIGDRFAGVEAKPGFQQQKISSPRPVEAYHGDPNFYLEPATTFFHAP